MKPLYSTLSISVMLLFTSCIGVKEYKRGDLNLPATYGQELNMTSDSIQLPWKRFFQDDKLVVLIQTALLKNNDIHIALKNLEQLDLTFKQAKLGLLPTLDFAATANRNYNSTNGVGSQMAEQLSNNSYIDDFNASLKLTWEIDIWGRTRLQKQVAKAEYFLQEENLLALKTRIIVQVAQAYYNLVSLDEQLEIANQNIALSDKTLQMMQLQYQAGQINSLAIEQINAQKKTAELLVPLVNQKIAIQENVLSILCGDYSGKIQRTKGLKNIVQEEVLTTGVPADLLSRRPDVKAAEYALVANHSKIGLAKVAMYPSISLSPQVGVNSKRINDWFDFSNSLTKTLLGNLTAPVFQKKSLQRAYKTAILEEEKTRIQFKQTLLNAVGEVSDELAKYKAATQRLELMQQKAVFLEKATNDAIKLYQSGMATYLEVITAQNNSLQNALDKSNTEMEKLNASVGLYRALGGGVE
ncbi:TolC family protein [Myroides pelagicus]|uniref:TolC family protein n=1 Tax=Myroides pelagicus TaxID=270914 RepID=UPI002DB7D94D|nr:TolC family protein [Myroides pelagicus]MEC4115096.1 TolC family protein [Myroides pelagicus]